MSVVPQLEYLGYRTHSPGQWRASARPQSELAAEFIAKANCTATTRVRWEIAVSRRPWACKCYIAQIHATRLQHPLINGKQIDDQFDCLYPTDVRSLSLHATLFSCVLASLPYRWHVSLSEWLLLWCTPHLIVLAVCECTCTHVSKVTCWRPLTASGTSALADFISPCASTRHHSS